MKKITPIFFYSMFLTSCAFDDYGDPYITNTGWILIVAFIIIFILGFIQSSNKQKKTNEILKKRGLSESDIIATGSYVGGHPGGDKMIKHSCIYNENDSLIICERITPIDIPKYKFEIPIKTIKNITVEDSTSIERRVSLGRIILVGIFALAWRKKKKNELAFVAIEWNDGKFEHSTLFSFEGKNAMQKANTARNNLIRESK